MVWNARSTRLLDAMGIQRWVPREPVRDSNSGLDHGTTSPASVAARASVTRERPTPADDWSGLESQVAQCTACGLHSGRTRSVFGVGNRRADWLVVGEAPGFEEDRRGEPFVGPAGKLLDAMLAALGLDRSRVYIANIVKCRPPDNRDPRPEESAACAGYLARQIEWIAPRVILAVGRVSAQSLLETDQSVGRLRGRVHRHAASGIPVVVSYHPAYLLRQPAEKRKSWQDLLLAAQVLRGVSGRAESA